MTDDLVTRLREDQPVTQDMESTIQCALQDEAADRIEELEEKLAKTTKEKLDAIDALNAWFDRRKLAHDAVDQAVVDAASGYLRTSRVGGMPQEESDLVLGVIQDMARLSVFADLFARTTFETPEEGKD